MAYAYDGRSQIDLRPLSLTAEVLPQAEGSVEIRLGSTRLICTASVEASGSRWLSGSGRGWVSAEYGMLLDPLIRESKEKRPSTEGESGKFQD